jgi:hypothetical protein
VENRAKGAIVFIFAGAWAVGADFIATFNLILFISDNSAFATNPLPSAISALSLS